MARFVLAGTHSNVGKTTISMGIMKALVNRGLNVQPFKSGPDYIDPAFHTFVTDNVSRNLDAHLLKEDVVRYLFARNSAGKDISMVEGVMGLYDGFSTEKDQGSTAHLSKIIEAPVVLIVDGSGMSASAAAQVLGYVKYDEDVNIAGVIINKVHGERHYDLLKTAIERDVKVKCLGYLNKRSDIGLESRHLGLIPSVEVDALDEKLEIIAGMVEETIDVDALLEIAKRVSVLECSDLTEKPIVNDLSIAIAKDKAFNFYYEDNLQLFEDLGVKLVPFSPMIDKCIPEGVSGVYLGGGFPEIFAKELEENKCLMQSLRLFIEADGPVYAECGGLMYLTKSITDLSEQTFKTVNIFEGGSKMTGRLQRFGYVDVTLNDDTIIGPKGTKFSGHEFHRSMVDVMTDDKLVYDVLKIRNGQIMKEWHCGFTYKKALGAYAHVHFYNNTALIKAFVESCNNYRKGM